MVPLTEEQQKLITSHKRMIEAEAARHARFLPYHVVLAEAYKIANGAAKKYDPNQGIKFSTYLVSSLKKLSRLSTTYGGLMRLPENKQFKLQKLNQIEGALTNDLGRAATLQELSEATGMPLAAVAGLKTDQKRDVNISNLAYTPVFLDDNVNDDWVHMVYFDLAPRDKVIMEHKTGLGGKPILSNLELSKQLDVSPATISNRVKLISDRLAEGWQ